MPGHALRFFMVVALVPRTLIATIGAACAAGCIAIAVNVHHAMSAAAPLLLLQIFATSSGFIIPARRGHYDLLLTCGARRPTIALVHWLVSSAPGVCAWGVLAAAELTAGQDTLTTSGTIAAVFLVSTVPWALNVPLPRLSGAIAWMLCFVIATVVSGQTVSETGSLLPWGLVGARLSAIDAFLLFMVGAIGIGAAVVWIERSNIPLENGQ